MRTTASRYSRFGIGFVTMAVLAVSPLHAQDTANTLTTPAPGNAASGLALVQSSKCMDCHRIGDAGSRVGPDLSDIGSRRSPALLQRAIVSPDDEVLPENRQVRIV